MDTVTILVLVVLNIPIYVLIGWIVFDRAPGKGSTFLEQLVDDMRDHPHRWGIGGFVISNFSLISFVIGSAAVVAGEYYLLQKYVLGP